MTAAPDTIDPHRFVLETFSDGGILLDLRSGLIFQLNRTAAFIWERALAGSSMTDIGRELTATYGLSASDARRDLMQTLALPDSQAAPPSTPYQYEARGKNYIFSDAQTALLEISPEAGLVRTLDSFSPAKLRLYLSSVTPKVAAALGLSVLHASAVISPAGTATLFTGQSGAGKTTTARALVNAGWTALSEDKVVLRSEGNAVFAVLEGERRIASWMRQAQERLRSGAGAECQTDGLRNASFGRAFSVETIILIDASRRLARSLSLTRLGPTAAAREIFQAGFYGSQSADEWERHIHAAGELARSARTFAATMPLGLEALDQAALDYARTTTS